MLFIARRVGFAAALAILAGPTAGAAQTAGARGKLIVTVSDPSGAVIPEATVTIVGLEADSKAAAVPPATTAANGSVTFE